MKQKLAFFALGLVAAVTIAAVVQQTTGIYIYSPTDEVQLKVRTSVDQTVPWLEFVDRGTLAFSIPATGIIPLTYGGTGAATAADAKTAFGVQSGSGVTSDDGTVTNVFGTAFSSAPVVTVGLSNAVSVATNRLTKTTSQFILDLGANGVVFDWIAVGAP